ncbi:hypothetical protein [Longimicrobium sp.]|uniref:hypothetical protein n=1 Tax=Longimicrobium sp. TaxID=2029185 RepID=UPI002B700FE3|nr:hypothetical protein [Longimicrobium sp.]HSU16960.1 hypothetical protein [Longimicrobium sp.]
MKLRTPTIAAACLLALGACGSSGQNDTGADTTAVGQTPPAPAPPPAPVTAPATPPYAPTGADSAMAGHNMGSDTMKHDTMKKDSTGM